MNFTNLDNLGKIEGFCLVKSVEQKTSSKGDTYLDFTLCDSTGEINGKLWRYEAIKYGEYKINDIVKVRGTISPYNGIDQLRIERIRLVEEADGVKIDDFIKSSGYSSNDMYDKLLSIAEEFTDTDLKRLVFAVYEDSRMALLYWPAAFKLHHAVRGGLLMHTLSVVRLAQNVCEIYPFVDKDLLIAGAMLHDISKIEEFVVDESGLASGYSLEGNLLGHLTMGAQKIKSYSENLGLNSKTTMLLEHMILSHHGEPEFGAAVKPMILEAELLSQLDLMDAQLYEIKEALEGAGEDGMTSRLWALDNRKFYHHRRVELDEKPNLI